MRQKWAAQGCNAVKTEGINTIKARSSPVVFYKTKRRF